MKLTRRAALGTGFAALTAAHLPTFALARTPQTGAQVPGIQRRKVGPFEVTTVLDGYFDFDPKLLIGVDEAELKRLLEESFLPVGPIRGAVNAYLVNTGDRLVLIDTGTANVFGPTLGKLPANLAAAGVDPKAVDVVLLTHMHPDHIGGAIDGAGAAAFPNAEMVVSATDHGFWTSAENAAKAPDGFKPFFQLATNAAKAYGAKLRLIQKDGEVVPGITAVALPGHTPGHTGYRIASGSDQLLITGDTTHITPISFARPDVAIAFDADPAAAAATRKRLLDMVATDRLLIAGGHTPFPGFGHVAKRGTGYAFMSEPWSF